MDCLRFEKINATLFGSLKNEQPIFDEVHD